MPKALIANFYGNTNPKALIQKYGSPIYVYNEYILKERCKEIKDLLQYPQFTVNYSAKANCNITLLKLIREAGIHVDTMSPGEIYVALKAGFKKDEILYIGNNVSREEMEDVIGQGIQVSVDSLSQLELFGRLNPGGQVAVRFNPGIGIGHHAKVITGGEKTKFGIMVQDVPEVKKIAAQYSLRIVGINQHIGSLFLNSDVYISGVKELLNVASNFKTLDFIDFGGGFGIPYHKGDPDLRLDLAELGKKLDQVLQDWVTEYGKSITFKVEPGRYLVAECGVLLGSVYATKTNYNTKYIGTDLGFNVLMRPVLYDAYHEIEVYPHDGRRAVKWEEVTIVGNICESGDRIAHNRQLPEIVTGDIIGIMDAGAYGYVMSSNYNNRLRPAEVLIRENGEEQLIRRRESLRDLLKDF